MVTSTIRPRTCHLSSGNTFYECERRRHNNCRAKIILCGEEIINQTHEHTHAADILRQDLPYVREEMKKKAIITQKTSQQTITQTLQNVSEKVSTQLPVTGEAKLEETSLVIIVVVLAIIKYARNSLVSVPIVTAAADIIVVNSTTYS
ncbi:Hypothetical predicted protein [Octopus vulgaris]|uniref:FLYWCH-type domain-containing protein n=1 Tax=Octopus vulgaris TaxID=6645 RepID=A0AA36BI27_OCTVU|nr:Hypothetical predicted protein [Octopus vulgaris]